MKPERIRPSTSKNNSSDLYFQPDHRWGGFAALTANGKELGSSIALCGLASQAVDIDPTKFMESLSSPASPGAYKVSDLAGEAELVLVVNDPATEYGFRIESVLNGIVTELTPTPHVRTPIN